jgi:hypothetical protein
MRNSINFFMIMIVVAGLLPGNSALARLPKQYDAMVTACAAGDKTSTVFYTPGEYTLQASADETWWRPKTSMSGHVGLVLGKKPQVYASADVGNVGYNCTIGGLINWWFMLRRIDPHAPLDIDLPVIIDYTSRVVIDISYDSDHPGLQCYGKSKVTALVTTPLHSAQFVSLESDFNKSGSKEGTGMYRGWAKPDDLCTVEINAICCAGSQIFYGSVSFTASLDPLVRIDPDFTVNVDGVDIPANQLYTVEQSSNLIAYVPLDLLLMD